MVGGTWVTLREASAAASVSISGLRKAAREGRISARTAVGPYGEQKLVEIGEVRATMGPSRTQRSVDESAPAARAGTVDAGQALELLDGWRRSLAELAVRLADEQERAGRAEERAGFLREQLAEERVRLVEERGRLEIERQRVSDLERSLEEQRRAVSEATAAELASVAGAAAREAEQRSSVSPVRPVLAHRQRWWRR